MALQVDTRIQIGGKEILEFTSLSISQSLFGHHHFSLNIPFDRLEGNTGTFLSKAHKELCGKSITISFGTADDLLGALGNGGKTDFDFTFQGIVTQIEVGNQGDLTGSFQVQGYSPTYLLEDAPVRRTFLKQGLAAIFKKVLQPYPADLLALRAQPKHTAPIPYLAQYDESNFAFLHRLAAQYGEWFYYDGKQLQLGRPAGKEIDFVSDGVRASFNLNISLRHSAFVVSQYNLQQHKTLKSSSASQSVSWLGQNPLASFALSESERLFPNPMQLPSVVALDSQATAEQVAARYKSQHATNLVSCNGWGENPDMQLGSVINASGVGLGSYVESEESFGKYFVTSIVHTVDELGNYTNMFEAVPWSSEHPPLGPYRAQPVGHPELAEVFDLQDPERLGRVRVRYYWPVEKPTDAETDWVRISTPYSGDGKGQLFTPEVGSQVLVGYEHNRAEQPLILGNLFHPSNKQGAKYTNPQNNLKGLQTAGGNKFVMTDTAGQQKIVISNSNNKGTAMEVGFNGDGSITIKSNGPVTVLGSTITLEAGDKGEIMMHAQNISIMAEEEINVSSATKNVALEAKEIVRLKSKDLKGAFDKEVSLNAGSKVRISSPDSDVI
ncbi:phage baseplate assembly protein V [Hymenobacter sp. HSC-4F20]|uniref:type VI secretion system Vgr family protein n=1 Tax=Hymenobacter sp. HSC-4F20 TaxID=2864135 RepID=UPI001C731DBD|nr:phage baseplate assembly protein V [Hymenobacter sp. HSC-4F20]MBX0289486.1 phage baseplate assembly protein V [Hymenobacter sp. HSC-4F20]